MTAVLEPSHNHLAMSHKWSELLNAHLRILRDHLSLWSSMKDLNPPNLKCNGVAVGCMERTQEMIRNVESLSGLTDDTSGKPLEEAVPAKEKTPIHLFSRGKGPTSRKRPRAIPDSRDTSPVQSASEPVEKKRLFTMDPNPSDVDALLNQFAHGHKYPTRTKQPSRSIPGPDIEPLGSSLDMDVPLQEPDDPITLPDATSARSQNITPVQSVSHEDEEIFMAKVNKRQQEKDEKRRKKEDKKRKRQSNGSVESRDIQEQSMPSKKRRRKLKQKDDSHVVSVNNEADSSRLVGKKRGNTITRDREKRQKID